jgi:glycosyltransferase involved in cell wall biosynthesis
MARHILGGFQKAAVVFHTTRAVRREIESHGLIDPARLVHAPNGVAPEFQPAGERDEDLLPPECRGAPFLLHVGSTIPRKRIDVLLDVFARVHGGHSDLRLVQAGGTWTADQRARIDRLGLAGAVLQVRDLSRQQLAALYRRARLVLQPSEAEGFGLPVIEALACGQTMVASDLSVLREVGGAAVVYCPVADVPAWSETVTELLNRPDQAPAREQRLAQAAGYSWQTQARTILGAYQRLRSA